MPLYEYVCQKCQHEFEKLVFNADQVECPQCHEKNVEKLWSVPARPQTEGGTMPSGCDPSLPPCGGCVNGIWCQAARK